MVEDASNPFPAECHFKIIAEAERTVQPAIERALDEESMMVGVHRGHASAGGKYITFNVSMTIPDRDTMVRLDRAFRAIEGVRMVL